jgi:peptidyl-prolyl cis-trans isomerase D
MLKTMRKNVKSLAPTLWIVIAAFIIAIFAVWGGAGRLGESARTETIATMGDDKISIEDYQMSLRQRLESIQKEFRELNKAFIQQLNIPQQVLEQMIQQSLLSQKAKDMGIAASDEEVGEKIRSLFQRDGQFIGFQEYRRILEYNRTSVGQFENSLKQEIILNKLIRLLTAGIAFTPDELGENYKKQNETAKIEYILLEESKVPFDQPISDEDIQAYFEKNRDKYALPERREGNYVFISTDDLKKEIQVSDSDSEKYYQDNLDQFKEPERVRVSRIFLASANQGITGGPQEAQDILDRIAKGEDFGALAKAHSQDEKAATGGDWGYDDWRRLSAQEIEEIGKLSAGQVSGSIERPDGMAILKVTDKEPAKTQPLEQVRERIKGILEDQKARDLAGDQISRLEKSARREKSLDVAAQKADLKPKSTGLLKQGQALGDIDPAGSFSQALFELKDNEISAPIYTFGGTGIVELEKIEPPRPAQLEEVRTEVERDLRQARKKELALQKLREARSKLEGKNWEELAPKLDLDLKTINEHKREQYLATIGESPEIDRLAFTLPINQVSEPIEYSGGYALLRVLDRKEASREEFEKNKETEINNLLETKKNRFLQAYLDKLRDEKQVRVNYNLFMQVNNDVLARFE